MVRLTSTAEEYLVEESLVPQLTTGTARANSGAASPPPLSQPFSTLTSSRPSPPHAQQPRHPTAPDVSRVSATEGRDPRCVFASGLPEAFRGTEGPARLRAYFTRFGELRHPFIVEPRINPEVRPYAFVYFLSEEGAAAAVNAANHHPPPLSCKLSRDKAPWAVAPVDSGESNPSIDSKLHQLRVPPKQEAAKLPVKNTVKIPNKDTTGQSAKEKPAWPRSVDPAIFRQQLVTLLTSEGVVPLGNLLDRHRCHFKLMQQVTLLDIGAVHGLRVLLEGFTEIELAPWVDTPAQGEMLVLLAADHVGTQDQRLPGAPSGAPPAPISPPTPAHAHAHVHVEVGSAYTHTTKPASQPTAPYETGKLQAKRDLPPIKDGVSLLNYLENIVQEPRKKIYRAICDSGVPAFDYREHHIRQALSKLS